MTPQKQENKSLIISDLFHFKAPGLSETSDPQFHYKNYSSALDRAEQECGMGFTQETSGPQFHYKNYSSALDRAEQEGGMGFTQEMMIHNGKAVKTTRPLGNSNVFRALCLNSGGQLALYESQNTITFGDFINALLSEGVKEALYTDMGPGWDFCFYRLNRSNKSPQYLHSTSLSYASNFIILKTK